jgi:chloramphenicol-sensitive protein RarD
MNPQPQRTGALYATAAFLWWGVAPLYFKAVAAVPATEVLAHRIFWSLVFLIVLQGARGRLRATLAHARDRRTLATMAVTTVLIATNWLLFIWSIANARLVEASLGYFINPLVNVLLGFVFLRERLRPRQWAAVALAAAGVVWLTIDLGRLPWIALALAFSFGVYGLLRKQAAPSGLQGLTLETALLAPAAAAFLWWRDAQGALSFGHAGTGLTVLLALAGPLTALPLIWYAEGAKRLRYVTIGLLQYLAPTCQFLLAVIAFGEPFPLGKAAGFAVIWLALGLYSGDALAAARGRGRRAGATVSPGPGRGGRSRPR